MSDLIAVVGRSGSGKSTATENLDPQSSYIINLVNKPLPFKGARKRFNSASKNYLETRDPQKILEAFNKINEKGKHIKIIVLDDFQYLMSGIYMDRAKEKTWDKFVDIGQYVWRILRKASQLRDDLKVFVLCHEETVKLDEFSSQRKIKTIGKMLDEKVTLEGLFTIVLFTYIDNEEEEDQNRYGFYTQSDGTTTAKSPKGMFDLLIPNDLDYVAKGIDAYYNDEDPPKPPTTTTVKRKKPKTNKENNGKEETTAESSESISETEESDIEREVELDLDFDK